MRRKCGQRRLIKVSIELNIYYSPFLPEEISFMRLNVHCIKLKKISTRANHEYIGTSVIDRIENDIKRTLLAREKAAGKMSLTVDERTSIIL